MMTDGSVIRRVRDEDIPALYETFVACLVDGRGMVMSSSDVEDLSSYTTRAVPYVHPKPPSQAVMFVADIRGTARGQVAVRTHAPAYLRHVGMLSLEVHPTAQRLGLGRRLMLTALEWAAQAGILRLELYVRADNHRAIALYESVGFVLEAVRKRFLRLPDGTFVDDRAYVLMF